MLTIEGLQAGYGRSVVLHGISLSVGATGVTAFTRGDGDGDGNVDEDDYNLWRRNFGNTRGGTGGGSVEGSVPEPSSVALVLAGLSWFVCRRNRRK